MTNSKRITNSMRIKDIQNLLKGEIPVHGTTVEDAIAFLDERLELLAKKNSGEKKPTATQIANKEHQEKIVAFLTVQSEGVTCTTIQKGVPELAEFSNQKVASLVRALVDDGRIRKEIVKGRALFFIA